MLVTISFAPAVSSTEKTSIHNKSLIKIKNPSNIQKIADEIPDEEREVLRQEIIERIIEIKDSGRSIFSLGIFNKTDPDGPLEGGMDDISDLISFWFGYIELKEAIRYMVQIMENPNISDMFMMVIFTRAALVYFGEAFDTKEYFKDGR